jgi:hypothetical protein
MDEQYQAVPENEFEPALAEAYSPSEAAWLDTEGFGVDEGSVDEVSNHLPGMKTAAILSAAAISSAVTADAGPKVQVKSGTYNAIFQATPSGFAMSVDNSAGTAGCVDRSDWCGEWKDTSCTKDSAATKGTGAIKFGPNGAHSLAVWSDGTVRFESTSCVEVRTSAPHQTQASGLNFKSAGTRKARIFVDADTLVINAETIANHDRVCAINEYHDADNLACASCPAGELSPAGSIGASSCAPADCADGTIASAHCTCDTGFAGGGDWVGSPTFAYPACADIDECNPNSGAIACGGTSTCNNNLDHFTCTCDAAGGWEGSDVQDTTCTAITCGADQHVVGNACADCAADSKRAAGDLATSNAGTSCDINECATNSGSGSCMHGACYDSWTDGGSAVALGAYRCDCTTGSGFSGTDCNECAAGMGYDSGEAKCVACSHPQFNDETTHNAPCVDQSCPVGSGVVTDCASGNWDTSGDLGVNCEVCGNGYISGVGSGVCTLDSANGYVDPGATKAATGCAAEWYVTGSTCTPCPLGSARATATTFGSSDACLVTSGYAGGSATTDATGCAAGFYQPSAGTTCAQCNNGYEIAAASWTGVATQCTDIDECASATCGDNAACTTPSVNGHLCSCDAGFSGTAVANGAATCSAPTPIPCYGGSGSRTSGQANCLDNAKNYCDQCTYDPQVSDGSEYEAGGCISYASDTCTVAAAKGEQVCTTWEVTDVERWNNYGCMYMNDWIGSLPTSHTRRLACTGSNCAGKNSHCKGKGTSAASCCLGCNTLTCAGTSNRANQCAKQFSKVKTCTACA